MQSLEAIVYSSRAARPLGAHGLDALLIDARAFNEKVQVTGALIHSPTGFLQYFEGPSAAVARVYAKIQRSRTHEGLVELLHQPVETRQFTHWHMAFTGAPASVLEELTSEYWEMTLPGLLGKQAQSPGLRLLLDFWGAANDGRSIS